MRADGYELGSARNGTGEGVFSTRDFSEGDTVVVGVIECRLARNNSHATQVGRQDFVLLAGVGSKVNHSCDPNCGIHVNHPGAPDLVARRRIRRGEEITFDYAMRNYGVEHFPRGCKCGAQNCRGSVTGWKDLPSERRAAYRGLAAPYLLELDRESATRPGEPSARRPVPR